MLDERQIPITPRALQNDERLQPDDQCHQKKQPTSVLLRPFRGIRQMLRGSGAGSSKQLHSFEDTGQSKEHCSLQAGVGKETGAATAELANMAQLNTSMSYEYALDSVCTNKT